MRFNTFINRKSSYSACHLALEIAAISKFAYRDQLICISSKQERTSAIMCELQRIFAHLSELNQTHVSELKRPETIGIRIYAILDFPRKRRCLYSALSFTHLLRLKKQWFSVVNTRRI